MAGRVQQPLRNLYYGEDDDCFDVDNARPLPPPAANAPPEVKASFALSEERERQKRVLYLQLLCQGGGPVTEVIGPIIGTALNDEYTSIFKNSTNNPVRVQVFADLTTPGCGARIALSPEKGDQGRVDQLVLAANGRTESVQMILLPTMSVWARQFNNAAFPMVAVDMLRVRIFDPIKLLSFSELYPMAK